MLKIRKQDIWVIIIYLTGITRLIKIYYTLRGIARTRFIAFHNILTNDKEKFIQNLKYLKYKTNVVSMDEYFDNKLLKGKNNIVITFDDGYKNWTKYAMPELKKLGLPAIFFISSGFIGLNASDNIKYVKNNLLLTKFELEQYTCLLEMDVQKIVKDGFSVGGHTRNHVDLSNIKNREMVEEEIINDKYELEKIVGVEIKYFAYPIGFYKNSDIDIIEVVQNSGYRGAVTTRPGFNELYDNPYMLNRDLTGASMAKLAFRARVNGSYDIVSFIKGIIGLL